MKTFRIGGVHPRDYKLTADKKIMEAGLPKQVILPLSQHIGAPCAAVVSKGDAVKVGQLIGKANGFVSANIHSPVSGVVSKVDMAPDAFGLQSMSVYIDVQGDEWLDSIDRSSEVIRIVKDEPQEIITKITNAGIVGLGGACFPTQVKLMPPPGQKAEVLIINAVECEPFLTCDHRLMLEHAEELFIGISIWMKALCVQKAIVGIESNKQDAIELFKKMAMRHFGIDICVCKMQYPQGGEKQLIDAAIGRQVPSGQLPISVGAVVQNVATVFAVYEAVQKNKPLIDRVITITGPEVSKGGNFRVRFGTPMDAVMAEAGGLDEHTGKIIIGGPMMGKAAVTLETPITKRSSGILVLPEAMAKRKAAENCMRCGKCVDVCPMGLEPYLLMPQAEFALWDDMERANVMDCIECGCCLYSCPSNRPLLDYIRVGKATVGNNIRNRNVKK